MCVCVCVFIQDSHIRKFSAVFLHGFSRKGMTAAPVTGLRRPPSAVCAGGGAAGMCPYSFIAFFASNGAWFVRLCKVSGEASYGNGFLGHLLCQIVQEVVPNRARIHATY